LTEHVLHRLAEPEVDPQRKRPDPAPPVAHVRDPCRRSRLHPTAGLSRLQLHRQPDAVPPDLPQVPRLQGLEEENALALFADGGGASAALLDGEVGLTGRI
jgi:hypothetical protein